jgi:OFA family oxalate/formate antiporter-like MFS transporter
LIDKTNQKARSLPTNKPGGLTVDETVASADAPLMVDGKHWRYVWLGVALMFFLGLIYTWSIFISALETEFGWDRSESAMPFSLMMAMFCPGCLLSGLVSRRLSGPSSMRLAAMALGGGFVLSAVSNGLILMCLAYGAIVGLGAGLAYNTTLGILLKWFPDRLGLASGLMLMGIGYGSFALSSGGAWLLDCLDWRHVFLLFGGVTFAIFMILAAYVKPPGEGAVFPAAKSKIDGIGESAIEYTTWRMIRRPSFILFFIWSVMMCAAGLTLIGHASPLAEELAGGQAAAGLSVGLITIFNGLGRSILGIVVDRLGHRATLCLLGSGFVLCGLLLALCLQRESVELLYAALIVCGLLYGGAMPAGASVIGAYGLKYYQMNLSVCILSMFPASFLGPYLAGALHAATQSYFPTAALLIALGAVALLVALPIRRA